MDGMFREGVERTVSERWEVVWEFDRRCPLQIKKKKHNKHVLTHRLFPDQLVGDVDVIEG